MGRRRAYNISMPMAFLPLIAPVGFDPTAQAVNIYAIINAETDPTKAYIYQFSDTVNTLTLATGTGLSYKYGYTLSGTDYTYTTTGIVNPFSAGMTKRWVMGFGTSIISNPFQAISNGIIWVYMHRVTDWRLGSKNALKYVHTSDLTTIIPTPNQSPYALVGDSGLSGILTIPSWYTTIPYQFMNSAGSGVTGSITIPSGVTDIGYAAFQSCSGFNGNLSLPSTLTLIYTAAFAGCNFINNLTIPSSVTSIGALAFNSIPFTAGTLTFLGDNIGVNGIGDGAFTLTNFTTIPDFVGTNFEILNRIIYLKTSGNKTRVIGTSKNTSIVNLTLANTITDIGALAFYLCSSITGTLTLSSAIVNILDNSFRQSGISSIASFPSSLRVIGQNAFYACSSLTGSLLLNSGLTTIGGQAFINCTSLSGTIHIPASITSLGNSAFSGCTGFTILDIESGYNPSATTDNYTFNFSSNFTATSLNTSIINIASGTKTVTIGATNKARLLAAYPTAETNANARGITIV